MQRGFRNGMAPGARSSRRFLLPDAVVNHEKDENAHCERRRPDRRASHDRLRPCRAVNSGQRLWLLCSMRVGNSAFRGISTPSVGINGRHGPAA
jgi:hypothetical protein